MTDEEFDNYWEYLVKKKRQSANAALSSDERVFYAVNTFRGSVPRSGLIGYFENTECDVIRDAHHGLATLGLPEALRLLQEAQTFVLNGDPLPETDRLLPLFDDGLPEEELEQAMDDLDEKVRDVEDQLYLQDQAIFDSLCRFADERNLRVPQG
jgi:hypothetical protein